MYQQYKIVVNTAAGRRRYMQYLIPFVMASEIVDRYDIWVNTHNGADIEFFRRVAQSFPKVHLVWQPDGVVCGNASINAFYRACCEPDTVYFKLDDDIVWMEPGLIEKMVRFRLDNPSCFLVSPLVVNNALCTYAMQVCGKLRLDDYYPASASSPVLWKSGNFARELHEWFINRFLLTGRWTELYLGKKEMGMTRFSINAVLWFGREMAKFEGIVPDDDEEFLSCIYPTRAGLSNAWNGDAIVAHFAFFTQREELDRAGILGTYGAVNERQWRADEAGAAVYDRVQKILHDVEADVPELEKRPSPYRKIEYRPSLRARMKRFIPSIMLDLIHLARNRKDRVGYIMD